MRGRAVALAIAVLVLAVSGSAQSGNPKVGDPDVNRDGVVDNTDVNLVKASLGKRIGQPGFNPAADVNGDGIINVTDLTIVLRAVGMRTPTISATLTPPPNAAGWNNSDVTVTFSCGNNPASCPPPVTVSTEGAGQKVSGSATNVVGTATATATINLDKTPPVIALFGPTHVLPGDQITMTAKASDNQGVTLVTFLVDGGSPTQTSTQPYQRLISVPSIATPGGQIKVHATAQDAAGNTTATDLTLTIGALPDTTPPSVTINVPSKAAPGSTVRFSATATDDVGVASLAFLVNGSQIATFPAPPFETTYQVPANALIGSSLNVTATAADYAGNKGSASGMVSIAQVAAPTPPAVKLTAPSQVTLGSPVTVTAAVTDATGISSVAFLLGGVQVTTLTAAPFQANLTLPAGTKAGSMVQVQANAINLASLSATDSAQVQVVSPAAIATGMLAGTVYDDSTGLPLSGALATLAGNDAAGSPYTQTSATDTTGHYVLTANQGQGTVQVTKPGWTRVDRPATIVANQATDVFDARLTAAGKSQAFSAVLGGNLAVSSTTLTIQPGALQADGPLTVTRISQQGIESLLPGGWSPMAAVDIAPHGVLFLGGAALATPSGFTLAPGTPLVLATWDEQTGLWRAVSTAQVGTDGTTLQASVPQSGEYAWLLADTTPAAPPAPASGDVLPGFAPSAIPGSATAVVDPQPKILFYKPGIQSSVRGRVTTTAPLSSASLAQTKIVESYSFRSGSQVHTAPYVEDLVLYQVPGTPTTLWAGYPVTPSLIFDPVTLDNGVITVTLQTRPDGGAPVADIPTSGGTVSSPNGQSAQFTSGASSVALPASVQPLTLTDVGITLPATLSFVDGLLVTFPGTLGAPLVLSVAQPTGVSPTDQLLFVRAQEIGGATRLLLVAVGKVVNGQIVSDTAVAGTPGVLDGPLVGGRYLVLKAASPVGFEAGNVLGTNGTPFPGALVSSNSLPIVALSRTTGRYVNVTATGAVLLTALDLQRSDTGTGSATVTNPGDLVALDLRLLANVPTVLSVTPANGATNVLLSAPIVANFSEPIDPTTVNGAKAGNVLLKATDGTIITGTISLNSTNSILTFRPSSPLTPNVKYSLTLGQGIADVSGHTLSAPYTSSFTSMNTAPPPTPGAGTITATIPDLNGNTTVTASQGTADVHDTVTVIDVTTGVPTPVILNPNGGFSTLVVASPGDKLRIQIVDPNGNSTNADLPHFQTTNADGSLSVLMDSAGGHIDGPGGIAIDVPAGAFPDGTTVRVKPVAPADFPVPFSDEVKKNFTLTGAIQLDFGGQEAATPLSVSIPAGPNDKAGDQWLVTQVLNLNGQQYLQVVDTASVQNGRIVDPPKYCPGVLAAAVYGFAKATQSIGLDFASMYSNGRYQLQAQIKTFMLGSPVAIPYTEFSTELPFPSCFPVIVGHVSVTPNTVNLSIPTDQLYPADRQIIVSDTTRRTQQTFARNVDAITFDVTGSLLDSFQVQAQGPAGSKAVPFTVRSSDAGTPGAVTVAIDPDQVAVIVKTYVITDLDTGVKQSFPVALDQFRTPVEGSPSDTFKVTAVPAPASNTPAHDVVQMTIGTIIPGNGNLVARADRATIDPTRAEANAAGQSGPARTVCPAGQTVPDPNSPCGVVLSSASGKVAVVIPDSAIVQGGFQFPFDGDFSDVYTLTINYDSSRPPFSVEFPRFIVDITNFITGEVIQEIVGQSPPKDQPLDLSALIGRITNDLTAPILTAGPALVSGIDAAGAFISFTFDKAMDALSLKNNVVVTDSKGNKVPGQIRVSDNNTTVTFVPDAGAGVGSAAGAAAGSGLGGLQMGQQYTVTIKGAAAAGAAAAGAVGAALAGACTAVCDAAGNLLASTVTVPVSTFGPQLLQTYVSTDGALKDVAIGHETVTDPATGNKSLKTTLFVTTGSDNSMIALDATDVSHPLVKIGNDASSPASRQRVTLVPQITIADPNGGKTPLFSGDLAITTTFNAATDGGTGSFENFVDVTDPTHMKGIAREMLTQDQIPLFRRIFGAVPATGYAKGIAALTTGKGTDVLTYAAVEQVGLFAVDAGKRLAGSEGAGLASSGIPDLPGDFTDVVTYQSDKLVAIKKTRNGQDLVIVGSDLSVLGSTALPFNTKRLRVVEKLWIDLNGDGQTQPNEVLDLAVVAGDQSLMFVLLGSGYAQIGSVRQTLPQLYGLVPITGTVRDVEIDAADAQAVAAVDSWDNRHPGSYLYIIDMHLPNKIGLVDVSPKDGFDDRIRYQKLYPSGVNGLRFDTDRGLLYVANPVGLDVFRLGNLCCDLVVDMTAQVGTAPGPTGGDKELYARELAALKNGITMGLQRAADKCSGFSVLGPDGTAQLKMWESGSSACLWGPQPDQNCGSNYQPGVSDHDISTFMPDAWYNVADQVTNPDKDPNNPKDKRPATVVMASCVVQALTYPFTNPNTGSPREANDPLGTGFKFEDISFLPNYTADLKSMRYRLARTMPGIPGDSDNTLGLGMQGLILKHMTEANGVNLAGASGLAAHPEFLQVSVPETEIIGYLKTYRTGYATCGQPQGPCSGIPNLEGYEWGSLMEYQLRKAAAYLSIRGAASSNSQFHDLFISQLHLAGKSGIRAALGRLSALPETRDLLLSFRRTIDDTGAGPPNAQLPMVTLRGTGADGCLKPPVPKSIIDPVEQDLTKWVAGPCGSMEEFVASTAVRSLTLTYAAGEQPLFTKAEALQTYDFYRVKADELEIRTDDDAANFIAATHLFVIDTKNRTKSIYDATLATEPLDAVRDEDQGGAGAPDPEGLTTSRFQRRNNNLARKNQRMLDKKVTHLQIIPHVFNRSFRAEQNIKVGMYYQLPGTTKQQYAWPQYDSTTNTSTNIVFENILRIVAGQHQYLTWRTDADGTLARDRNSGDPNDEGVGKTIKLFELDVDQTTTAPDAGYVVFTVDLPQRSVKEANRKNNYEGFFFSILQPGLCAARTDGIPGVICPEPPGILSKVPFPLDSTLLDPDTECAKLPDVVITQSLILNGTTIPSDPVDLRPSQVGTLVITLTNDSDLPATNVQLTTTLTGQTFTVGTIAPGATVTEKIPYSAAQPTIAQSLPTVISPDLGVQTGTPFNILVGSCAGPLVTPLSPDPNPTGAMSTIDRGGVPVRYFRVIDGRTLTPIPNASVEVTLTINGQTQTFFVRSDATGLLNTGFYAPSGLAVPPTFIQGLASGTQVGLQITKVNGQAPVCETSSTTFAVNDLSYTNRWGRGSQLEGTLKLFAALKLSLMEGSGMEKTIALDANGAPSTRAYDLTDSYKASIAAIAALDPFKSLGSFINRLPGQPSGDLTAGASASIEQGGEWGRQFSFPLAAGASDLSFAEQCALVKATIATEEKLPPHLLDELAKLVFQSKDCSTLNEFLSSVSVASSTKANAQASGNLNISWPFVSGGTKGVGITASGSTNSTFAVETAVKNSFSGHVPDRDRGEKGDPTVTSVTESYTLTGNIDWSTGLTAGRQAVAQKKGAAAASAADQDLEKEWDSLLTALKVGQKTGNKGSFNGAYRVAFTYNTSGATIGQLQLSRPTLLTISYTGDKLSGWAGTTIDDPNLKAQEAAAGGSTGTGTRVYSITDPDTIDKATLALANLNAIRKFDPIKATTQQLTLTPTYLNQEYGDFLAFLQDVTIPYTNTEKNTKSVSLPTFKGSKKFFGVVDLNLQTAYNVDNSIGYTTERGTILRGKHYPLEVYAPSLFPAPDDTLLNLLGKYWDTVWGALTQGSIPTSFATVPAGQKGAVKNTDPVELDIDATNETQPLTVNVASFHPDILTGPQADMPRPASSTSWPAGQPLYGIGGFHVFGPYLQALSAPATLIISFSDSDVAGINKSALLLFAWNQARNDWDRIPGTLDPVKNTMTATVQTLTTYTLGLPMPAGVINFTTTDNGTVGGGDAEVQRFRITTDVQHLNTGAVVPDGTMFSVRTVPITSDLDSYGNVITADADPTHDGIQVASHGGVITFDVQFPAPSGAYLPGKVLVYATSGTSYGASVLQKATQP